MSCDGCIFDGVGSINEPCFMCKINPYDNRQDNYYQRGIKMARLTNQKIIPVACLMCIHETCMEEGNNNDVISACYMCKNNPTDNRPSEFVEKKIYCC